MCPRLEGVRTAAYVSRVSTCARTRFICVPGRVSVCLCGKERYAKKPRRSHMHVRINVRFASASLRARVRFACLEVVARVQSVYKRAWAWTQMSTQSRAHADNGTGGCRIRGIKSAHRKRIGTRTVAPAVRAKTHAHWAMHTHGHVRINRSFFFQLAKEYANSLR